MAEVIAATISGNASSNGGSSRCSGTSRGTVRRHRRFLLSVSALACGVVLLVLSYVVVDDASLTSRSAAGVATTATATVTTTSKSQPIGAAASVTGTSAAAARIRPRVVEEAPKLVNVGERGGSIRRNDDDDSNEDGLPVGASLLRPRPWGEFFYVDESSNDDGEERSGRARGSVNGQGGGSDGATRGESYDDDAYADAHPIGLAAAEGRCVEVRFRPGLIERDGSESGNEGIGMSAHEAIRHIKDALVLRQRRHNRNSSSSTSHSGRLDIGLEFLEDPDGFWSWHGGSFHLYHFMEFAVVAYRELGRIRDAMNVDANANIAASANTSSANAVPPLDVSVPWIYVPLMTREEICGTAGGINCVMADMVFPSSSPASPQNVAPGPRVYGLESNDAVTRGVHPAFRGKHSARVVADPAPGLASAGRKYLDMVRQVDAVMLINRSACVDFTIHKMWWNHTDHFPASEWHEDVMRGLAARAVREPLSPPAATAAASAAVVTADSSESGSSDAKLVVGYVDRQATGRRLPNALHEWLVRWLSDHPRVDFRHLRMEKYTALEQVRVASRLDVLVGMHGNGLTHLLWMEPNLRSYVLEFFWEVTFHYDYATAAVDLMRHNYAAIFNGRVLDADRIGRREKSVRKIPRLIDPQNRTDFEGRVESAKSAVSEFIKKAVAERLGC